MAYAIVSADGRQYWVTEGQELEVDYRGAKAGEQIVFDRVLAVGNGESTQIGQPVIAGATVTAEVLGTSQGPKLVIQKFRRRKNSRRRTGHRQIYNRVKITSIAGG